MGEYARWKCQKGDGRVLSLNADAKIELAEKEFFEALGDMALELEKKDRTKSEDRFFNALGYIRFLESEKR